MPPKEGEMELSEMYALEEKNEDLKDSLYKEYVLDMENRESEV